MPPFRSNWSVDYEDLSADAEPEDDFELQLASDRDWDALLQDDLTPTRVVPPKTPPAALWPRPASPVRRMPMPPPPSLEATSPAAYYAAPRTPPRSYQPEEKRSSSIAPVMVTPAVASPPRLWPMILGAGLVGCAAIVVATMPLLLKGAAFHEATTVTYVTAAPATRAPKVKPQRQASVSRADDSSGGRVFSVDDLPTAEAEVIDVDDLPVAAADVAPPPRTVPAKSAPTRVAVRARPAAAEVSSAPKARLGATLHLASTPPVNVVVDGRPVGMTPKSVRLEPGTHNVVFVGPEARAVRTIDLPAGSDRTVAIKF